MEQRDKSVRRELLFVPRQNGGGGTKAQQVTRNSDR